MVREYASQLYEPAHVGYERICRDRFAAARDQVRWHRGVVEKWPQVRFVDYGIGGEKVSAGSSVPMRASLDLAGLTPGDVRVEAVVGRVGAHGELEDTQVLTLSPEASGAQQGSVFMFGRDFAPFSTGRLGYALRVCPNHCDDPLNRPCNALLKWAGES
jgi:starch phosphorylase